MTRTERIAEAYRILDEIEADWRSWRIQPGFALVLVLQEGLNCSDYVDDDEAPPQ